MKINCRIGNISVRCTFGDFHRNVLYKYPGALHHIVDPFSGADHGNICSRPMPARDLKVRSTVIFVAKRFNHRIKVQSTAIFVAKRFNHRFKVQRTAIFVAKRFNHRFKVQSTAIFVAKRFNHRFKVQRTEIFVAKQFNHRFKVQRTAIFVKDKCVSGIQGAEHRNICSRQIRLIRIKVQSSLNTIKAFGSNVRFWGSFINGASKPAPIHRGWLLQGGPHEAPFIDNRLFFKI